MNQRLRVVALFFAIMVFFVLTLPANHSEAEDAYFYAQQVEQGAWSELFHAHHLLYLPVMRVLFLGVQALGYTGRSLPILIAFSMVCGAGALCLFQSLLQRSGVRGSSRWFFSLALLFSYGFWRYSTTAEIYIPVTFLSLAALYFAERVSERPLFLGLCVASAALALLTHLIALPVILLAIPLWIRNGNERRTMISYCALTLLVVAVGYAVAAAGPGLTVYHDTQVVRETLFSPRTWMKAAAAWGQCLLSANFLFALPVLAGKIEGLFPYHMLQEELFVGQQAPRWVAGVAPVTLASASVLFLGLLWGAVRSIRQAWQECPLRVASGLIWLAGVAGMAFLFEPANPEMWICTLMPFWLCVAFCCGQAARARWIGRVAGLLVLALFAHNLVGGMALVKSSAGDYCRQKSAGVVARAREGDLILTADSHGFVTFLQYATAARVVDAKFIIPDQWPRLREQTAGRIFVLDDVLNLLPPVARRSEEAVRQIRQTADLLRPRLQPVDKCEWGVLYQCL